MPQKTADGKPDLLRGATSIAKYLCARRSTLDQWLANCEARAEETARATRADRS